MIYNNIIETIGKTPVVRINNLAPDHVELYVKAEFFNPAASVKDRLAMSIIEEAEISGALKPGQTVVEATSGNTGIGLAMVCAAKGYPLVIVMADSFSVERRQLMRLLGAKVVLTPRADKAIGMYNKAIELAEANGWFLARQFETSANAKVHEQTTGPEIIADFAHKNLTHFVTGFGTGGTLTGTARVLRRESPDTRIILSEPGNAGLIESGIAQKRSSDGSPVSGHPAWEPHPFQGWSPDFIPAVLQEALDNNFFDELMPVAGPEAIAMALKLAAHEGILTGISGGGTVLAAVQVAAKSPPGSIILAMLPDTAERYLSTPMFDSIEPEMTSEERAISMSTPRSQMASGPAQ
ncbi:PLP-dependent cysteine synthase family protein [Neptunicoccus cionae]|uniref:Cysteine synthase B n=1 Tax=Neptunicoccus cionae TaxID=2035344 RepID=A0A916VSZ9_9RHOB|nr:pyridoxal-phosphate dependent enzyme [Amylibacter cionae]GGA28862.1 cysteine synthase A [Amylibacter cionae]